MKGETVVKWKFNFVWQDAKEEAWLRGLAREGWHLESALPIGRYVFRKGEPRDVVYRMDYTPQHNPERDQLFVDAGWERAIHCIGWNYWRKLAGPGPEPQIFTDSASRAVMLERVRNLLLAVTAPNIVTLALNGARSPALATLQVLLIATLLYGVWNLSARAKALRARPR
ncbi:MAG: DUF2812 domain-containing protein [Telluria sp.]